MLTSHQAQIVQLIEAGMTDRQISIELGISPGTVNTHTKRLYRRFGAHCRMELVNQVRTLTFN